MRRRKTWYPKPGMTKRQIETAVNKFAVEFEQEVYEGFRVDDTQTFSQYAEYVMELKERIGVRERTIDRYHELLVRINEYMGSLKLVEIRPQHLNEFYKYLSEVGVRSSKEKAISKIDMEAMMKRRKLTRIELSRRSGLAPTTLLAAIRGEQVSITTAEAVAHGLGMEVKDAFRTSRDMTPLSNKTILEYHRLISTIMAQAEKEMIIKYNPAARATPPKVKRKDPDYFQPDVVEQIIEALDDVPIKWKALTYLLIDTGCRRGEAVGLKWDCIDLDEGIITIKRTLLYDSKRGTFEGPTKTGNIRCLRIAPETLALIKKQRISQIEMRFASGDRWIDTGYVFTQDNGDLMSPDSVTSWLNKFSAKNGLPHIHPHAFRHTAASIMIANGIDLVTTANELGHANATTTATIYAHQISSAKARASEVRAGVFARGSVEDKSLREQIK